MPQVRLKRVAREQLEALPDGARADVERALLRIESDPSEAGVRLLGRMRGRWRAREGGYRIIYRLEERGQIVIVEAIRHRRDAY